MRYWLIKSEPTTFSIDDLKVKKRTGWDGVRNYQARNFMRDEMKQGDLLLFYHSNAEIPGIAGIAKVSKESYPDPTQFDPSSKYFDPAATKESPRWFMVEVEFQKKLKEIIPLSSLKAIPALEQMMLLQKGSRLSVTPVKEKEYQVIEKTFLR